MSEHAVEVPSGFSNYMDALFSLRCVPDLLAAGLFPNTKEWTECYGLYRCAREYLGPEMFGRRDVLALDIGCGTKPRLGALVACMTRWSVAAIDPRLKGYGYGDEHKKINGLTLYPCQIDELHEPFTHSGLVVSFHCHSHAPLASALRKVIAPRHVVIVLPCCKRLDLPDIAPVLDFDDAQILSPKRRVRVWDLQNEAVTA